MEPIPPCESEDKCWQLGQVDIFHALQHWVNFNPHSAQEKIIRGMKKYTTIAAGRRFGKSKLMAALSIYGALTHKNYIQYVIAPTADQAKIIFSEARAMTINSPMASRLLESTKDFPFPEITFKSGSVIYARSTGTNEGKYLRGHYAHRIIMDEDAFVKKDTLDVVIAPMLADVDGDMIKISTPFGRNHFYEDFALGEKGEKDYASFQFSSFDNPHISHSYLERQRAKITDLQFRSEYMGEFVDDQVCVFKWETISDAMRDFEESYQLPEEKGRQYYVGVDLAKMHDFTTICVMDGTNPKDCVLVYTERFNNRPYAYVVERIFAISLQFQPVRILMDETGVGEGPTEQVMIELPVAEGFKFTQQSKIALINTLKTGLEQRRIKFSAANRILSDELRFYQYDFNEETGSIKMSAPSGKNDDFVIALALAYMKCAANYGEAGVTLINTQTKPLNKPDDSLFIIQTGSSPPADKEQSYPPVIW